jgi:hypothetical protein
MFPRDISPLGESAPATVTRYEGSCEYRSVCYCATKPIPTVILSGMQAIWLNPTEECFCFFLESVCRNRVCVGTFDNRGKRSVRYIRALRPVSLHENTEAPSENLEGLACATTKSRSKRSSERSNSFVVCHGRLDCSSVILD